MQNSTPEGNSTEERKTSSLDEKLSDHGRRALNKLCEKCDCATLAELFVFLSLHGSIKIPFEIATPSADNQNATRTKLQEISFDPLDDFDSALYPLTKEDVQKIADTAQGMVEDIRRLKRTALVRRIVHEIPSEDLLGGSRLLDLTETRFRTILALPRIIKEIGQKQRPEYTQRLTRIYQHIHERTGKWHDTQVAHILNDLFPNPEHPHTQGSLKQWRYNHGLTDERERGVTPQR